MKTTLYIDGNSLLHRLDPRTKMAWLCFSIVLAFIFYNPIVPLVVILVLTTTLLFATGKKLLSNSLFRLIPIILLTVTLLHGFVNPIGVTSILIGNSPIHLPYFGDMKWEGLYVGIVFSLRIISVFLASLILVLTTRPEDLVTAIVKLGVPFQYASLLGMSLQMIPIMQEEARIIIQAQRARGLRENNIKEKIQALVPLFVPLAVGSMQRAETTAMVLEARAFGALVHRTELRPIRLTRLDLTLLFAGVVITIGIILTRVVNGNVNWVNSVRSVPGLFWPLQ
jgi:energy-coupling factor transport system permease protein